MLTTLLLLVVALLFCGQLNLTYLTYSNRKKGQHNRFYIITNSLLTGGLLICLGLINGHLADAAVTKGGLIFFILLILTLVLAMYNLITA